MRTNYVLIDYESVQPTDISALHRDHFRVIVFVGAHQTKIPIKTAAELQQMGSNAEYVQISGRGPNALDFHIAFYIGHLASRNADAYFYIISKDAGFDPLLHHLKTFKTKKIGAIRVHSVRDVLSPKAGKVGSTADRLEMVVADLRKRGTARPRTVKTLTSTVAAIFLKKLSPDEIGSLLRDLQAKGWVSVEGNKVTYNLPT